MKIRSLDHIHIYAVDPESSAQFYETHFDATPVTRNKNINGDTRIFLALGGQILVVGSFPKELSAASPPAAGDGAYSHGFGIAHIGLRVESVEDAIVELRAADVSVLSEPITDDAGITYAYLEAPDGVVLELTQY